MHGPAHSRLPNRYREPNYSADDGYTKPPSSRSPEEARQLWDEVFKNAENYYRGQRAPDPDVLASNTAWKTVELYYRKTPTGKLVKRNPSGELQVGATADGEKVYFDEQPEVMDEPGNVTWLGKVVELAWIDAKGNLRIQRFRDPGLPDLAWNHTTKTLMTFPTAHVPAICDPSLVGLEEQAKMLGRWAQGREAKCHVPIQIQSLKVAPVGVADTLVYRSDKFDGKRNPHPDLKGAQEYVHQFNDDVFVEESAGKPPEAILISGGRLDVEERGIIH